MQPEAAARRVVAGLVGGVLVAAALGSCSSSGDEDASSTRSPSPSSSTSRASSATEAGSTSAAPVPIAKARVAGVVATGLDAPWGIAFLPDGSALVSERDTEKIVRVTASGEVSDVGRVAGVAGVGEGGLLGIALSPSYADDHALFAYYTHGSENVVARLTYDGTSLAGQHIILDGIPSGPIHNGGRLAFGPDGYLYVSTGEAGRRDPAQNRDDLGGKILRITPNGDPAPGNPFPGSPVWTLGHRNVQGLAWDDRGRMWASEFGQSTWDELNRIVAGDNYGWPEVEGRGNQPNFRNPQIVWHTAEASPSGLAFLGGHLWLASLRGERLWRIDVDGARASHPADFFVGKYGRMRTVVVAPDGNLWVTTSNRDGRGKPASHDDRILLVRP